MDTSTPKEYLTLRAGPSNNYASVYDNMGEYTTLIALLRGRENGFRGLESRILVIHTKSFNFATGP